MISFHSRTQVPAPWRRRLTELENIGHPTQRRVLAGQVAVLAGTALAITLLCGALVLVLSPILGG